MPLLVLLVIFFVIFAIIGILIFIEAMRLLACGLVMLALFTLLGA